MISIIIPVKNNRNIDNCLSKLVKIPKPSKVEIIVVDASTKPMGDIKSKYKSITWIYYNNKYNKKYTVAEQRNLGIKNAKGDYIAFIDSDCLPDNNWLIELYKPMHRNKELFVAGKVISSINASKDNALRMSSDSVIYRDDADTANTLFKKIIFKKVGYFDESFEAGEDIDFSWRAIKAGFKIRFQQSAIIYDDLGNFRQKIVRAFRYGSARIKLYSKHTDKLKYIFQNDITSIIYPTFILLLPISFFFYYYPLLLIIPLLKNINKNPINSVIIQLVYGLGVIWELLKLVINRMLILINFYEN